jgi:hypothetical protein
MALTFRKSGFGFLVYYPKPMIVDGKERRSAPRNFDALVCHSFLLAV